jgi:cyclopropane-fatty-acyl-phospholipid synthase
MHALGIIANLEQKLANARVPPFSISLPDGTSHSFVSASREAAQQTPPEFHIHVRTETGSRALLKLDELSLATAYLQGDIDIEGSFLSACSLRNFLSDRHPILSVWRFMGAAIRGQVASDKKNTSRHYDSDSDFYFAFLDKKHHLYSQAGCTSAAETLEQAASNKLKHVLAATRLERGSRVLDVGAGWGSFATYAASAEIDVTMLTVSRKQYEFLQRLTDTCTHPGRLRPECTHLQSYHSRDQYDAIVLLGVMEHLPDYSRFFNKCSELLGNFSIRRGVQWLGAARC